MAAPLQTGQKGKGGKAAPRDPLSFEASLDTLYESADHIKENATLTVTNHNQFWLVLPDGILPNNPDADVTVAYLRFTAEGRRSNMLTRMVMTRNNGVFTDTATGRKLILEFRPCVLLSRSKEGSTSASQIDDLDAPAEKDSLPPEPEGTKIPDIGELLDGLHQTRKSLDTIDSLMAEPDAFLTPDEEKRRNLQESMVATKDKALIGLSQLGDVLARGPEQSLDEWRAGVSQALSATIEAMVALEDLSDQIRDEKRRELELLRQSIEAYFSTIDPSVDFEACRKFSSGVNKIILKDRKDTLQVKKKRLEKHIERSYDHIIASLQQALGKGSSLPLIPHPVAEPAEGYDAKFVMNMIHIVMAVRFGGLSIRLDTEQYPRFHGDRRGWDQTNPPRVHIVDQRRFAQIRDGGKHKLPNFA